MPAHSLYSEKKTRSALTLTPTAVAWLEAQRVLLGGRSSSDVIEKLARGAVPVRPAEEPDQLD